VAPRSEFIIILILPYKNVDYETVCKTLIDRSVDSLAAAAWITKVGSKKLNFFNGQLQSFHKEIMSAQKFKFAHKLSENGFSAQKLVPVSKKIYHRLNFTRELSRPYTFESKL